MPGEDSMNGGDGHEATDRVSVYDLCMNLAKDHVVSDATFKKARAMNEAMPWRN